MNHDTLAARAMKAAPEKWVLAGHIAGMSTSIIREILKISSQPGVISLAGGYPSPDMFPLDDLKQAAVEVIDEFKSAATQYSFSMGIPLLREAIAERETRLGSPTKISNVLITSGSQQGIDICARAFLEPGDYIVTENPTYVGALQAFNYYQINYAPVEMDRDGMLVDQVEDAIKKFNPKLVYTVSTFQNPTGVTMSDKRKRALIELCIKHNIPLVDDNPYGEIRFAGEHLATMKDLGGDAVISLGTFSKLIAPGLRIGWMNGPEKIVTIFEKVKQGTDLHSNTYTQYIIHNYIRSGKLDSHIQEIVKSYGAKRNLMLQEMEKHFPDGITWTNPEGGLFLWVELPKGMSASKLLEKAVEQKVTYVYGRPFFPDGTGDNTLRLNFSNASHEQISEAIRRLAVVFGDNKP